MEIGFGAIIRGLVAWSTVRVVPSTITQLVACPAGAAVRAALLGVALLSMAT